MGGNFLVSVEKLLRSVYPEMMWESEKFQIAWDDVNKQKRFLDWAGKKLGVTTKSHWYNFQEKVKKNKNIS